MRIILRALLNSAVDLAHRTMADDTHKMLLSCYGADLLTALFRDCQNWCANSWSEILSWRFYCPAFQLSHVINIKLIFKLSCLWKHQIKRLWWKKKEQERSEKDWLETIQFPNAGVLSLPVVLLIFCFPQWNTSEARCDRESSRASQVRNETKLTTSWNAKLWGAWMHLWIILYRKLQLISPGLT